MHSVIEYTDEYGDRVTHDATWPDGIEADNLAEYLKGKGFVPRDMPDWEIEAYITTNYWDR